MEEIWKNITGFPKYQISNLAMVRSCQSGKYKVRRINIRPKLYDSIVLTLGGVRFEKKIHRLVALQFVRNPKNKLEVNHIDGNRRNNKASNLEWVTCSENHKHACRLGLIIMPRSNIRSVQQLSLSGKVIKTFDAVRVAAKAVNGHHSCIIRAIKNHSYSAHGYRWKYV